MGYISLIIYGSISLLATFIIIISMLNYKRKCKKNMTERKIVFTSLLNNKYKIEPNQTEQLIYNNLLLLAYSRLKVYYCYQVICKVFGITSLLFTGIGLISFKNNAEIASVICSIISLISVIVVIYINPLDRARDYLASWRMWNEYIAELFAKTTVSIDEFYEALLKLPEKHNCDNNLLSCDKN